MIRALAIDLDGTITDAERRLDLQAVALLREVVAHIPVVLATGNVLCYSEAAAVMLGTRGPLIAENGGAVKIGEEVEYFGDIARVEEAFRYLAERLPVRKATLSDLRRTEIALTREVSAEEIRHALQGFGGVEVVDTKFAIHIKDQEVNKGRAMAHVAGALGIDLQEFAAIGDSPNDREMLAMAGCSIGIGGLEDVSDYTTAEGYGAGGREALAHLLTLLQVH